MVDAQLLDDAADVRLGLVGDEPVVEGEGQHAVAHVHQAAQHVGAVLAAAQESEAVVVGARPFPRRGVENLAQLLGRFGSSPPPAVS